MHADLAMWFVLGLASYRTMPEFWLARICSFTQFGGMG